MEMKYSMKPNEDQYYPHRAKHKGKTPGIGGEHRQHTDFRGCGGILHPHCIGEIHHGGHRGRTGQDNTQSRVRDATARDKQAGDEGNHRKNPLLLLPSHPDTERKSEGE